MKARNTRLVRWIGLGLGIVLFAALLASFDFATILDTLAGSEPAFVGAVACYFATQFLTARAWSCLMAGGRSVPFRRVLAATWGGHALNQLTPGATAGEVYKATLLDAGEGADRHVLWSSVVSLNLLATLVGLVWVAVAASAAVLALRPGPAVTIAVVAGSLATGVGAAGLARLVARGATGTAVDLATRLPGLRSNRVAWCATAARIDTHDRRLRAEHPGALAQAVACLVGCRALQLAEVAFLVSATVDAGGLAETIWTALFVQAAGQILSWLLVIVPGQIGVAEAGSAAAYALLGLSPVAGLSMELLRRARKVIGIAIGLVLAAFTSRTSGGQRPDAAAGARAANEPTP